MSRAFHRYIRARRCVCATPGRRESGLIMEIPTTESTIQFQEGLIGFYDCKSFRLIAREEIAPFRWLQSVDRPDIGFLVIDPSLVISGYKTVIPNREWESL